MTDAPVRRRSARLAIQLLVGCVLLLVIAGALRAAQVRTAAPTGSPQDQARRALNRGDYAEAGRLLSSATDPTSVALRAQIDIDKGRYAEAEQLLAPVAAGNPASEAALRLGTLQLYLGRRADGQRVLERLVQSSQIGRAHV